MTDKDGGTGKSNTLSVQVVAASGNIWTTVAPLPTQRYYLAAGVVNGILYVVGGSGNGVVGATVEEQGFDLRVTAGAVHASRSRRRSAG